MKRKKLSPVQPSAEGSLAHLEAPFVPVQPRASDLPLALLQAMRPKQWTKNGLLFAAMIFAEKTFDINALVTVCVAVGLFCVLSSCGYLFNDLLDIQADRGHPRKRKRPIASGRLPVWAAVTFMVVAGALDLAGCFWLSTSFGWTAVAYLTTTLSYTLFIKHMVILDVMAIAAGFILRAVAGGTAIMVDISPWFITCAAFVSLFIAMCKRLSELTLLEGDAGNHRKNLKEYTPELLKQMINVAAASTIMSYALYTFDVSAHPDNPRWLMLTLPIVIYAIFRYQYLVLKRGEGGAPELTLLMDRPLQITVLLYGATVIGVLYLT